MAESITQTVLSAIKDIATEKNIDENNVSWHQIAIHLAKKINASQNPFCQCGIPSVWVTGEEKNNYCLNCKKEIHANTPTNNRPVNGNTYPDERIKS